MCELCKRSCFSTSCFVSVLQNSDKKVWTSGQVMIIQKKKVSASCIFLFIRMGYIDKFHYLKPCFLFHIFFLSCTLPTIFKCGQVAVFLFCVFFLLCTFKIFSKSVDRWTNSEIIIKKKIFNLMYINIIKCGLVDLWTCGLVVDLWTRSYLPISCFLSLVYLPKYFQKVWTGGHAQKSLK